MKKIFLVINLAILLTILAACNQVLKVYYYYYDQDPSIAMSLDNLKRIEIERKSTDKITKPANDDMYALLQNKDEYFLTGVDYYIRGTNTKFDLFGVISNTDHYVDIVFLYADDVQEVGAEDAWNNALTLYDFNPNHYNQLVDFSDDTYYYSLSNIEQSELLLSLTSLMENNIIRQPYSSFGSVHLLIDEDIDNPGFAATIYRDVVESSGRPVLYDTWNGNIINREHVWPNSFLGIPRVNNTTRNIGSDFHNLRICEARANQTLHNNYNFADENSFPGIRTFYPGDSCIGDVARILFYMYASYQNYTLGSNTWSLELTNHATLASPTYAPEGAKYGILSQLLRWHYEDPVDEFEIQRNERIFEIQKNRNPFIDYPQLVTYLFKDELALYDIPTQIIEEISAYIIQGFKSFLITEVDTIALGDKNLCCINETK